MHLPQLTGPAVRTVDDSSASDERLMEAICAGDEDALESLIGRHWNSLIWYATGKLGAPDEAEDVAQEVFVRLWEHRGRWDAGGSLKGYLYRIAHNLIVNRMRHTRVRRRVEPELLRRTPSVVTPIDSAVHREFHDALEQKLRQLPERRKEAFILVRTLGLGLDEAAQAMGVSRRTVANHVYLAVTDLQKGLRPFLS